jgi:hypothetical protein
MDPSSISNWPQQNKRKFPFDADQKAWLDNKEAEYRKKKSEGSSGQVLAHNLALDMDSTWAVEITDEILGQCKTEDKAKTWAIRSRGQVSQGDIFTAPSLTPTQSIYWYYTNKQRGKKMGKSNSSTFSLSQRKKRKKSQAQCFSKLFYKVLNLEAAAVALRDEFIQDNPAIAKRWRATPNAGFTVLREEDLEDDDEEEEEEEEEQGGKKKKKATDPTAIVRFRQVAIKQAWAQASEEHRRATIAEWEKQHDSSDDNDEDLEVDAFPKTKNKKRAE